MGFQAVPKGRERAGREPRIAVEEADVAAARDRDALIHRGGEAAIDGVPDQRGPRKARRDLLRRSVLRSVVHHDRFDARGDRFQARGDEIAAVERDDDDGNVEGRLHFSAFPVSHSLTYRAKM